MDALYLGVLTLIPHADGQYLGPVPDRSGRLGGERSLNYRICMILGVSLIVQRKSHSRRSLLLLNAFQSVEKEKLERHFPSLMSPNLLHLLKVDVWFRLCWCSCFKWNISPVSMIGETVKAACLQSAYPVGGYSLWKDGTQTGFPNTVQLEAAKSGIYGPLEKA